MSKRIPQHQIRLALGAILTMLPPSATEPSDANDGWGQMGNGVAGAGGFVIVVRDSEGPITRYTPGVSYTVVVSNTESDYAGLLLQSVRGNPGAPNSNGVGEFSWSETGMFQHGPCQNAASTVTQTFTRAFSRRTSDVFQWLAPPRGTGTVTFHLVGVRSQFLWYGAVPRITATIEEDTTPVQAPTWSRVRSLFR